MAVLNTINGDFKRILVKNDAVIHQILPTILEGKKLLLVSTSEGFQVEINNKLSHLLGRRFGRKTGKECFTFILFQTRLIIKT